jgi:hypothetical protein
MKRSLDFDAMEQRVLLSGGIAHPGVTLPVHAVVWIKSAHSVGAGVEAPNSRVADATGLAQPGVVVFAAKPKPGGPIKGTFKGGQSELLGGSLVYMTGSSGKLGSVAFDERVEGQVSGNSFLGGTLLLGNSQGTMSFTLEPGTLKKSGKDEDLKVIFIIGTATGTYLPTEGSAGNVTIKLGAGKSSAKSVTQERLFDWDADWLGASIILGSYSPDAIFYYFCPGCREV